MELRTIVSIEQISSMSISSELIHCSKSLNSPMDFGKLIQLLARTVYAVFGLVLLSLVLAIALWTNPNLLIQPKVSPENWKPRNALTDLGTSPRESLVKFGFDIITETSKHIGPMAPEITSRLAGNNLSCQNCHLDAGRKAGSASFVGVANRFPQYRGREDKMGDLIERVNGCMERSMDGEVLPIGSLEMQGIIAYMEWLSEDVPEERVAEFKGFANVELPDEKAKREWLANLRRDVPWLDFCDLITISAKQNKGIKQLRESIKKTILVRSKNIPTGELNRYVFDLVERNPVIAKSQGAKRFKVKYTSMIKSGPPTFLMFTNKSQGIPEHYRRYLVNAIRSGFKLYNTPVHLIFRTGNDLADRMKKSKMAIAMDER